MFADNGVNVPGTAINLVTLPDGRRAVIMRTSDSISFKQCRRKWKWSSHLKDNLTPQHLAAPLWFGSAIHYALEDYHGWNRFGSPSRAFIAYCVATAKNYVRDLPTDHAEHFELGKAMMDYYENYWLRYKPRDQTFWAPSLSDPDVMEPQVEVNFEIPIPIDATPTIRAHCERIGADVILYRGTIDKVIVDEYGSLWVGEYKTAKVAFTQHYQTDPQVSRYMWALAQIYDRPVAGVIYQQFVKRLPELPRINANGKVSTASNLTTSYPLYRQRLLDLYGEVERAPIENVNFLASLAQGETEDRDKYIIRDKIRRTVQQVDSQGALILLELEDMLNPDLPLYPNPTRDCSRMCSFLSPCVSVDDGNDWELELANEYTQRDLRVDRLWRSRLPDPDVLLARLESIEEQRMPEIDLGAIQVQSRDDALRARIAAQDESGGELFSIDPTFDITAL